jgi:hypothetical protein
MKNFEENVMRWMMLLISIVGFVIAFTTKSAGIMAISIFMIVVGLTGFVLGMAAQRVANNSRDQVYVPTAEEIALIKQRAAQKSQAGSTNSNAAKPEWKRNAGVAATGAASYTSDYAGSQKELPDSNFDNSVDGGSGND